MCELLVGLPGVDVTGVSAPAPGWLIVHVAAREQRPNCDRCGTRAWVKDYRDVDLVDLPAFDQRVVLRVTRTRWCRPAKRCGVGSWAIERPEIAPAAQKLTTRAGRWATEQVGRNARSVSEVADALGTDWHTINDAVIAYGEALIDADVDRIGVVRALSLDETLFMRDGPWRTQRWCGGITVTIASKGGATFGAKCRGCTLRPRCTSASDGRHLTIHPHDAQLVIARRAWANADFIDDYRRHRPMVERSIAWLVAKGNRRVRYRGLERSHHGLTVRVAAINLRRLVNLCLDHDGNRWILA